MLLSTCHGVRSVPGCEMPCAIDTQIVRVTTHRDVPKSKRTEWVKLLVEIGFISRNQRIDEINIQANFSN